VECDAELLSSWPENNSINAYYRDAIYLQLSNEDESASSDLSLDAPFDSVMTTSTDGTLLIFTPTTPLQVDAPYEVVAQLCLESVTLQFKTSAAGNPIENLYSLDDVTVEFAPGPPLEQNALLAKLIGSFKTSFHANGASLDVVAGFFSTESDEQENCIPTSQATLDLASDGDFTLELGESWVPYPVADDLAGYPLVSVRLKGSLGEDGYAGGVTLTAELDERQLPSAIWEELGLTTLCDSLNCFACDDGEKSCVSLEWSQLIGSPVEDAVELIEDPVCGAL
jgi:hypothetical protein